MATPTGGGTPTSMPVTTSSVGPVVTSSAAPPGSNAPKGTEKLTVLILNTWVSFVNFLITYLSRFKKLLKFLYDLFRINLKIMI